MSPVVDDHANTTGPVWVDDVPRYAQKGRAGIDPNTASLRIVEESESER